MGFPSTCPTSPEQAGTAAPGCSLPFGSGQPTMLLSRSETKTRQNPEAESFKAGGRGRKRPSKPGWGGRAAIAQVCLGGNAGLPSLYKPAGRQVRAGSASQIASFFPPKQTNSTRLPHVARILSPHLPVPAGKARDGWRNWGSCRQGTRFAFQTHRPKYLLMFPLGSASHQKPPHPFQTPIKPNFTGLKPHRFYGRVNDFVKCLPPRSENLDFIQPSAFEFPSCNSAWPELTEIKGNFSTGCRGVWSRPRTNFGGLLALLAQSWEQVRTSLSWLPSITTSSTAVTPATWQSHSWDAAGIPHQTWSPWTGWGERRRPEILQGLGLPCKNSSP